MFDNTTKAITDAVTASKEESALEAVITVVGGRKAQRAVMSHQLPRFVADAQGRRPMYDPRHG